YHVRRQPRRQWLNTFWIQYASQKWHLCWKWQWHIRMPPFATAELIYTLYWGAILRRNRKTMSA
ncbi:MAG TPA: hypothetical protein VJG65_03920, partial [Patescibacteria group bacterium]|nr:hypothetical protein [Patescibacteria group bacterium]